MTGKTPGAGDIVILDFDPILGHEQAGKRPALVVSPLIFNDKTGFAWVCPITSSVKGYPFEVAVTGTNKTTGVILADQLKSLDWKARRMRVVDKVSEGCLDDVKTILSTIIDS